MPTPRPFNAPTAFKPNISSLGEITRQVERMKALTETSPKPAAKPGFNPMDWLKNYTQGSKPKTGPTPAKPMPPKAGPTKPNIPGSRVLGGLARVGGAATAISPDKSIGLEERALGATMAINPLLGTAVAAGAGIGQWMQENFAVNTAGSGRGAGRSSFNSTATAQPPESSRGLPADYKETEQKAGKTAEDYRSGAGFRSAPAPDGNGSTGTRTSHSPVTMEFVDATMLQRGGLGGKDYKMQSPFSSNQLPATSATDYFQENPDYDLSRELPENMYSDIPLNLTSNVFDAGSGVEYGKNLPQFPASGQIEYLQKDGAPLTVSSGTFKVTEANESAQESEINKIPPRPRGGRQLQNWENKYERKVRAAEMAAEREKSELEKGYKPDMERRAAFLDDDLNSMEALRASEATQGLLVTGGTYNMVNPKAGQEGENDFVKIDKAKSDTIKRGGDAAQKLKDSYVTGIIESTKKPDDEEDNK